MIAAQPDIQARFAILPPRSPVESEAAIEPAVASGGEALKPFGDDGFTFLVVLDIINPLQHLPVIGTLYRELTGDTLAPAPRIVGDILFGGPIGAFLGIANAITESATGKDMGQHALALLRGDDDAPNKSASPATQVAAAATGIPAAAASEREDIVAKPAPAPASALFQILSAIPQPTAATDSALEMAMKLTDDAGILDARRVTFAPPSRSRIPLAPPQPQGSPAMAGTAQGPAITLAPARPKVVSQLGRTSLLAVTAPPEAQANAIAATAVAAKPKAPDFAPPAGGAAVDGGWFSETMLSALRKYEQDSSRCSVTDAAAAPVDTNP